METITVKTEYLLFPKKGQPELGNGFAIVSVSSEGYKDNFAIKGSLPGVHSGMTLSVTGDWKTDKWGRSFVVSSFEEQEPTGEEGIRNYLSSGLIKGIGPVLAEQIVKHFGTRTLSVLNDDPDRLKEIPGIGPAKLSSLRKSWQEQKGIRDVMVFLKTYNVGNALAAKIYRQYGDDSIDTIRENPYRLADEIAGVGFLTADTIALSMGMPADCRDRIRSCILYALDDAASKKGHVYLEKGELLATVRELLEGNSASIPEGSILPVLDYMTEMQDVFVEEPGLVYLPMYYHCERYVAAKARSLVRTPEPVPIDFGKIEKDTGIVYDDTQKDAIALAASSHLCVITGGPGTGKTTTMKGVIEQARQRKLRILLAAPTGRASKRLSESAGMPSKTIHRLLEFKPGEGFGRNADTPLSGDLLVVDESSMIDLLLMNSLLKAVPDTMRVVLVGDVDQLTSVGAGNILKDFIESGAVPVAKLTKIFRQAQDSLIVKNAHAINRGYAPALPGFLSRDSEDFCFVSREDTISTQGTILDLVADYLPQHLGYRPDDIQVLSPMRKGPLGTTELNRLLQDRLNPSPERLTHGSAEFRRGDRVIQIKNNYDSDVFNGDIGKITWVDSVGKSLQVDFSGTLVEISGTALDEIDLAYCTTIHKSQGSEYPVVIIPVTMSHYVMLMRNLLYTAVTRAKQRCILVGEQRAVMTMVSTNTVKKRNTLLRERLWGTRK